MTHKSAYRNYDLPDFRETQVYGGGNHNYPIVDNLFEQIAADVNSISAPSLQTAYGNGGSIAMVPGTPLYITYGGGAPLALRYSNEEIAVQVMDTALVLSGKIDGGQISIGAPSIQIGSNDLSAAIQWSEAGITALSARFTATSIIGCLNELAAAILPAP